jgi:hypothetical protein
MSDKPLRSEFEYFLEHQDELADRYEGKVIVVKGGQVIGAFDSVPEAVHETSKHHRLGTFLVQECGRGPECYTAVFNRVRAPVAG